MFLIIIKHVTYAIPNDRLQADRQNNVILLYPCLSKRRFGHSPNIQIITDKVSFSRFIEIDRLKIKTLRPHRAITFLESLDPRLIKAVDIQVKFSEVFFKEAIICMFQARNYIQSLPALKRRDFREVFRGANPLAVNLLELMLELDADK